MLVTAFKAARARRDQVRKREHTRAALHCPQPVFPLSDAGGAAVQFVQPLGKGRSPPESLLAGASFRAAGVQLFSDYVKKHPQMGQFELWGDRRKSASANKLALVEESNPKSLKYRKILFRISISEKRVNVNFSNYCSISH